MKQCRDCKITKQDGNFSKDKRNKDGLQAYCKICLSKRISTYLRGKGIEKKRNYQQSEKYHAWRNKFESKKRLELEFIKKRKARSAAFKLRDNKCFKCNKTKNLEAHHPDYNKPKETITLCRNCHKSLSTTS